MSKAFTRESDDAPEGRPLPRLNPALPIGAKNYLTVSGAQRLREELESLLAARTTAASKPTPESERRIGQLQQSLATAVIVPPPAPPWEQVRFGASVTVRDQSGQPTTYRIVGVDETDVDQEWVSWLSPIARALLNARLGERVRFKFPAGETELEISGIAYE